MDRGFEQGKSDNLPRINSSMMAMYFKKNSDFFMAETRGTKLQRSTKESYGDNAIGYVQVKRDGDLCTVKGKITPEHRVRKKAYSVVLVCNESEDVILSVNCADCIASQGGCKHAVAFLAWVHRRSEDPPVTSVKCYWKKSKLSTIGTTLKFVKASDLGKKPSADLPSGDGAFLKEFVKECKAAQLSKILVGNYFSPVPEIETLSLHFLIGKFKEAGVGTSPTDFYKYACSVMSDKICYNVSKETMDQVGSPLWHELRYGRITASNVHAAAHCNNLEGCLTESILGARFRMSKAMKRGQLLEGQIIKHLKQKINKSLSPCGLLLCMQNPFFGASPDAIADDFVVEVKCPVSESTMIKYFKRDKPADKHFAQIQLQMLFAQKSKGLFCVAHPDFEKSQRTTEIWVDYDADYCRDLISRCSAFWCKAIFPRL